MKATAEADVLTTSLVLAHYLQLTTPGCATSMCDRIASFAAKMTHRPFVDDFVEYRDRIRGVTLADARSSNDRLAA